MWLWGMQICKPSVMNAAAVPPQEAIMHQKGRRVGGRRKSLSLFGGAAAVLVWARLLND